MKIDILIGITAIMLLLALPAAASDYTLEIFGNANEDDTINMQDVTYTELIILEYRDKTELSDAKYDDKINMQDVTQIELVILGRELEMTLVDGADRIVTVEKPINRLVCTFDQQIEALRTLKVSKDRIVGVPGGTSIDADFFPEFGDIANIGTSWNPDLEAILELHPDLVLLHTSSGFGDTHGAALKTLETAGITVLRFDLKENYPDALKKFGYTFDKRSETEEFLGWYENILNTIEDTVKEIPDEDKPKVYPEGSGNYGISDCDDWAVALAGGRDIFVGESGTMDAEAVIEHDPDVMIKPTWKASGGYGLDAGDTAGLKEVRDEIMGRSELQNVKAVKSDHVYVITTHLWTYMPKTGNRHFIGICYMAKWFHPDLFNDMDPQAIHQEYLTRFQGLDIDLDEHGVFVYHPEEHPDGR